MMSRTYIITGRTVRVTTEDAKLDNPLPEPVKGRQKAPEFVIDCGDAQKDDEVFDALHCEEESAKAPAAAPETGTEDDFDFPVADDDDFDLQ